MSFAAPCGKPLEERVADRRCSEQARRGRADLAAVAEGAVERVEGGAVEIGVLEDDHRVLAAELEHDRLQPARRVGVDLAAGLDRAGEGDAAHQRMRDQRRAGILAVAGDDVDHACGKPTPRAELGEGAAR